MRFHEAIVDIGGKGVQGHLPFLVLLDTSKLRAAKTAADADTDALGATLHGSLDGALHGTAECHAALKLLEEKMKEV